jgi:hypothetical protein
MTSRETPFSLYLHIPYCAAKCPYCDFNVHVAAKIPEREYGAALLKELEFYSQSASSRRRLHFFLSSRTLKSRWRRIPRIAGIFPAIVRAASTG